MAVETKIVYGLLEGLDDAVAAVLLLQIHSLNLRAFRTRCALRVRTRHGPAPFEPHRDAVVGRQVHALADRRGLAQSRQDAGRHTIDRNKVDLG